ncbi:hypothetical protein LY76DRAFT_631119 [Colletotrichum caudatum]|nr:hypothetical protein LY76DRAFT_631119 [Colletotrichum caudatum]
MLLGAPVLVRVLVLFLSLLSAACCKRSGLGTEWSPIPPSSRPGEAKVLNPAFGFFDFIVVACTLQQSDFGGADTDTDRYNDSHMPQQPFRGTNQRSHARILRHVAYRYIPFRVHLVPGLAKLRTCTARDHVKILEEEY